MFQVERRPETNAAPRRAPIPRPWLRHDSFDNRPNDLDILSKPRWELSLGKLSSCCGCGDKKSDENRNRTVFPLIRRDSSRSLPSGRYELDSSDEGSVSSFTDSDSSSSYSSYSDEEPPRQDRMPDTPPFFNSRPPAISTGQRSRSTGLPPLNPNFGWTPATPTSQTPTSRGRADTGDFTKASGTTNTSRHRRKEQYEFSPQSLTEIWKAPGKGTKPAPMPPLVVQVPDDDEYLRLDASFASSFDDSLSGFESWTMGTHTGAPRSKPNTMVVGGDQGQQFEEWQRFPAPRPPRRRPRKANKANKKAEKPTMSTPVYLRKKSSLDDAASGKLLLSGWIAASFDSDAIETKLLKGSSKISVKDVYYMQIVQTSDGASILLYTSDGVLAHSLVLRRDWTCESREITGRIGKFVTIKSPTAIVAQLLPISLDDSFFNGENLVSSNQFSQVQNKLFAGGRGKVYAPDEQHDAATHIFFSLDALIKQCGK